MDYLMEDKAMEKWLSSVGFCQGVFYEPPVSISTTDGRPLQYYCNFTPMIEVTEKVSE